MASMRQGFGAAAVAFGLTVAHAAGAATPGDPSGTWLTEDGRARIAIEKCGPDRQALCGYVVWLKTPLTDDGQPRLDRKNPDSAKTGRALLGHQLLMGLHANAEARYEGQIYNSEDGKKYDVQVWLEKPGDLKVKGCLLTILCSTQSWTRATGSLPGQLAGATGSPTGPRADAEWAGKTAAAPSAGTPSKRDAKPRP